MTKTYPDDLLTIYNLSIYSLDFRRNEEASKYFQQLESLAPKNPHAQFGICCSLERLGHVEFMQGYLEVTELLKIDYS
jgi:hypothetical protein